MTAVHDDNITILHIIVCRDCHESFINIEEWFEHIEEKPEHRKIVHTASLVHQEDEDFSILWGF